MTTSGIHRLQYKLATWRGFEATLKLFRESGFGLIDARHLANKNGLTASELVAYDKYVHELTKEAVSCLRTGIRRQATRHFDIEPGYRSIYLDTLAPKQDGDTQENPHLCPVFVSANERFLRTPGAVRRLLAERADEVERHGIVVDEWWDDEEASDNFKEYYFQDIASLFEFTKENGKWTKIRDDGLVFRFWLQNGRGWTHNVPFQSEVFLGDAPEIIAKNIMDQSALSSLTIYRRYDEDVPEEGILGFLALLHWFHFLDQTIPLEQSD